MCLFLTSALAKSSRSYVKFFVVFTMSAASRLQKKRERDTIEEARKCRRIDSIFLRKLDGSDL